MFRRRCARCGNRIRIRSRSCRHCAWPEQRPSRSESHAPKRRVLFGVGGLIAILALLFVGQRMIEPTAIADWYAEFALQHLPRQFSSMAPAESASGAYLFCVRRVVKDKIEQTSVATFPSITRENTVVLADGVYRVNTYVYEDRADGERVKWDFTCLTQFDRNRWVLQDLEMGSYSQVIR